MSAPELSLSQLTNYRVHFIGLGGAGMSGIARIMLARGVSVSGSDAKQSPVLDSLVALGAKTFVGHSADQVESVDLLIVSSAISPKNPELIRALERGIPILARAQALALLMSDSLSIAVAGTHGKTTTTSMLTVALQSAGLDPSFAIGGMINSSGTNAHLGSGKIFVAEADESDGSFLAYQPAGAIITNIELDHVDHFPTLESVNDIFREFLRSIAPQGFLVACIDSPGVRELLALNDRSDIAIHTYGIAEDADYRLTHIALAPKSSSARVTHRGRVLGELALTIPGEHNLFNALAALVSGVQAGAPIVDLFEGLTTFSGARRRFEAKGSVQGIQVIDDYGHHPTEVAVTLATARRFAGSGRVLAIFQPHRYSRTQAFAHEFAVALSQADYATLLEVYAASEDPIPGVSSLLITRDMNSETSRFEPSMVDAVAHVVEMAQPGDVIVTMGAGDVNALAPVILQSLTEKYSGTNA
jgi:UDP-N-acetylmuramate--alanine ligase